VGATFTHQFGQELEDVNRALEKIEEGTYGLLISAASLY
jgi:RNA polymerase-binding transcription factor DksA